MKKVLIITYYWPPAGGPGVQRWLKFVKYLRDFNVEPVVYIPSNPTYPIVDDSLNSEIPKDIKILKNRIFEPYAFAEIFSGSKSQTLSSGIIKAEKNQSTLEKVLLYVRGNYFVPDARKFWVKPSVKFLERELESEKYDLVITTGPPHSLHLIGLKLKQKYAIKWLADFRDPWTNIGYHSKLKLGKTARKKHENLEREVLENTDHLLTTSFTTQEEFQHKTKTPVSLITNGYDIEPEVKYHKKDKFELAHIGSLLSGRNPENLWKVLAELLEEDSNFSKYFKLNLVGKVSEEVIESMKDFGLKEYIEIPGYVSHKEAVEMQSNASILLLAEINSEETRGIIPGKVFEYMAARKPILAIGPKNWDAGIVVEQSESGKYFKYNSTKSMKSWIHKLFHKFLANDLKLLDNKIESYKRKALTKDLADIIHSI